MALPVLPNSTCDIYRAGNSPPAAPDVAAVPCYLKPAFREGNAAVPLIAALHYTHVLLVAVGVDVRDHYTGGALGASFDTVYVPDKNGTPFKVIFVERHDPRTAADHKHVFLQRQAVSWPSDNL